MNQNLLDFILVVAGSTIIGIELGFPLGLAAFAIATGVHNDNE